MSGKREHVLLSFEYMKDPLNTVLFFKIHDVSDQNGLHISNQILYFTLILKNPLMIKRSFFSPSHCVLVAGFPNSPKLHNYVARK